MSKHTCCASVRVNGFAFSRYTTCGCNAKFEHDGKHYCGKHYPPAVKARQDKSMDEYRQKIALQNSIREAPFVKIKQLTEQRDELLEAHQNMQSLVHGFDKDGALDPIKNLSWESVGRMCLDISRAAIAKVKGEKL